MASTRRPPPKNVSSKLLSHQENETVFKLVGPKCVSVATSVTQVYFFENNGWNKKHVGVTCFAKDNIKRSYYIRIFDINSERLLWEQELYNNFKYDAPAPFFHIFQTDKCWAGLNFANDAEANSFKTAINDKIQRRQQRRQERTERRRPAPTPGGGPSPIPQPTNVVQTPVHAPPPPQPVVNGYSGSSLHIKRRASSGSNDKKKDKGGKKKLTKADISQPKDFKHISHVGWDPEKGFNVDDMDPKLKGWFNTIGVSDDQLKDQNTAKFIRNFIEDHGGLDAVIEDSERMGGPAKGGAPPPPPPSRGHSQPPPPPPPNRASGPALPSRPPAPGPPSGMRGSTPPAPPSSRSRGLPPPPPPQSNFGSPPAPPPGRPPMGSAPPPPPPPPPGPPMPPNGGMAPPPPPPPPAPTGGMNGGGDAGGRSGLLSQIQGGMNLRKVDPNENPKPAAGGRGALLDQIRGGMNLKKVTEADKRESPVSEPTSGLGAALFSALQHRANAIQDDDEDSENSEEFDDDEWEED